MEETFIDVDIRDFVNGSWGPKNVVEELGCWGRMWNRDTEEIWIALRGCCSLGNTDWVRISGSWAQE